MGARFTIRPATPADADVIAKVHMASIHSLGAKFYPANLVAEWGKPRNGDRYRRAMEEGVLFFVAVALEGEELGGFSSYAVKEEKHRPAVYIDEKASRQGVGTALLQAAEKAARANGAQEVDVASSLGAVPFYLANGFEKLSDGEHILASGTPMACVFMRKRLIP